MARGVLCPLPGRAASLPGEGSPHLRGCGMTAVGTYRTCRATLTMSVDRGKADLALGRVEV